MFLTMTLSHIHLQGTYVQYARDVVHVDQHDSDSLPKVLFRNLTPAVARASAASIIITTQAMERRRCIGR
jgi:hypothetical protein